MDFVFNILVVLLNNRVIAHRFLFIPKVNIGNLPHKLNLIGKFPTLFLLK